MSYIQDDDYVELMYLVFDDPTNHLDMESITALNNGLIKFPGVTLFHITRSPVHPDNC